MNTWHIHIEGQVQGVGFRPFVFVLAQSLELKGWVNNTVDGVHIVFNAEEEKALVFKNKITQQAPRLSRITSIQLYKFKEQSFDDFQIVHSKDEGEPNLLLTPDFALCEDCREELHQAKDRRYAYPFITCTNCGPRYSIIHRLPYDRVNTKMDVFQMCPTCSAEYENPLDRRYYSQTNSCLDCGIELTLFDSGKKAISATMEEIIDRVAHLWEAGKIIAVKGIGGYLLTCDASNDAAILELRKRKYRPSKPFALMIPEVASLKDVQVEPEVVQEMKSSVSPIVLLEVKNEKVFSNAIAPGLNQVGVMLPYTPLYDLLLKKFGKPIIATSGNVSNAPIVFQDEKALNELFSIADFILTNNRDIIVPQDDSVIKYSFLKKQKIVIRRSRGLAPTYINAKLEWPSLRILAMGAMLKSTFGFLYKKNSFISQYLGDLESFDTQQNYEQTIDHFLKLFNTRPEVILCDKHPEYPSTIFGNELSHKLKAPVEFVQHHVAHFGAVLGEHNLIHTEEPVLGVIWDGTGLGDDGQIWGGEFFKYEKYDFSRCCYFEYFNFILGDKMPKEPRISALSACSDVKEAANYLEEKFSKTEWQVYRKILGKENPLKTSSVGRIFDAVASLLGIMDKQTYEGEAAMRLEVLAMTYFRKNGLKFTQGYFDKNSKQVSTQALMTQIVMDLSNGKTKEFIAAKFHYSLIDLIRMTANNLEIRKIAFSGGVFQNGLLVDLILCFLKKDFDLYFHKELSPNDENISFGQLVCYQIKQLQAQLFN
ncbi:MAG: carbamoyltransferase HypF [Bacteroidota bacterium]